VRYQKLVNPELCGTASRVHLSSPRLNATQQAVRDELIGIFDRGEGKMRGPDSSFKIPVMRTMPTLFATGFETQAVRQLPAQWFSPFPRSLSDSGTQLRFGD